MPKTQESLDGKIVFEEQAHTYTVKATGERLLSVSGLVHKYSPPFDPDGSILIKCAAKKGITPEELQKEWDKLKDDAGDRGTRIHSEFEHFIKTGKIRKSEDKDIVGQFKKLKLKGKLLSEVILYSLEEKICGTTDLIEVLDNDTFNILDFKSNKAIKTYGFGKNMLYPLSKFANANYYHYLVQMNIYAYLFEKQTGMWPNKIKLLWINPKTRKIEIMEMENIRSDIISLLEHYKNNHLNKNNKENNKKVDIFDDLV